jgi:hypothetical protein
LQASALDLLERMIALGDKVPAAVTS